MPYLQTLRKVQQRKALLSTLLNWIWVVPGDGRKGAKIGSSRSRTELPLNAETGH